MVAVAGAWDGGGQMWMVLGGLPIFDSKSRGPTAHGTVPVSLRMRSLSDARLLG